MADMFGAPIGISQAGRDMDAQAMNAMNFLGKAEDLADAPVKREMTRQHARLYGAQADEKGREAAVRERILSRMAQGGSAAATDDPAEELERLGRLHLEAGSFEEGSKLVAAGGLVRARRARATQQEASAESTALQAQIRQQTLVSNWANSITDQASLDQALLSAQERGFNTEDIPRNFEAAKPVLERLAAEGITASQSLNARLREREINLRENSERDQRVTRETVRAVNTARTAEIESRRLAREKVSGTVKVNPADLIQANDFLRDQLRDMEHDPVERRVVAADMAHSARQRMRANPALTYPAALAQEYSSGDWEVSQPMKVGGFVVKKGSAKAVKGARPGTALPLPIGKDPKLLKPNTWYTVGGETRKWTGRGWMAAPSGGADTGRGPDGGGDLGGDDEEEDE